MVAYDEASVVVGLDVDKYHFDKYTMRNRIDIVLERLWQDSRCLDDLLAMAAPSHPRCGPFHCPGLRR